MTHAYTCKSLMCLSAPPESMLAQFFCCSQHLQSAPAQLMAICGSCLALMCLCAPRGLNLVQLSCISHHRHVHQLQC